MSFSTNVALQRRHGAVEMVPGTGSEALELVWRVPLLSPETENCCQELLSVLHSPRHHVKQGLKTRRQSNSNLHAWLSVVTLK